MKTSSVIHQSVCSLKSRAAFTLVEVMVASGVFSLAIMGFLAVHLYGLSTADSMSVKLTASDDARVSFDMLLDDIRSAGTGGYNIQIGSVGSSNSFTGVSANATQSGNALQIYQGDMSVNSNAWVRYYYQSNNNMLMRMTNGRSPVAICAGTITNDTPIFQAINYLGAVVATNYDISSVLVSLSFTKLKNPEVFIGQGSQYDFYGVQITGTRRSHQ